LSQNPRAKPASPGRIATWLALLVCGFALLAACAAPPTSAPASELTADTSAAPSEGELLYQQYCASCHRPLAKTLKPNRSVSRIHSAIRHYQVMRHLDHLTIEQLKALAEVLADR